MSKEYSSPEKYANEITFNLTNFSIKKFQLIEPDPKIIENFNPENLNISLNLDYDFDKNSKSFKMNLAITYKFNTVEFTEKLIDFELISVFDFKDIDIFRNDNDNIEIPNHILIQLFSVTYSGARGILFSKTQGSFLNKFLLPLVDPNETLKKLLQNKENDLKKDAEN